MRTVVWNNKTMPLAETATLHEAAIWISAKIPPLAPPFNELTWRYSESIMTHQYEIAKEELCFALMSGSLIASGTQCGIFDETEYDRRLATIEELNQQPINKGCWSLAGIEWDGNGLFVDERDEGRIIASWGYRSLAIPVDDLMRLYPHEEKTESLWLKKESPESYSTAFIQLMLEAIEHFKITGENQVVTKKLIPWFEARLEKMGETGPNNKAKMMATFVRSPESQKGGNKKKVKPANPS